MLTLMFFCILSCLENGIKRSVLIVSDNLHVTFDYIRNQKFNFKTVLHFYFLLRKVFILPLLPTTKSMLLLVLSHV